MSCKKFYQGFKKEIYKKKNRTILIIKLLISTIFFERITTMIKNNHFYKEQTHLTNLILNFKMNYKISIEVK